MRQVNPGCLKQVLVVLCLCAIVFSAASCKKTERSRVLEEGKAPDFTLSDMSGKKVTLSGLRGKVVLVEFWATWCPPCKEAVPEINKVYEKYKDKDVQVLAIAVDQGSDVASKVHSFVTEHRVNYPVLIDDKRVNVLYGVGNVPVAFIIDREGKVAKKHIGFMEELSETISRDIEALL
jgi:peroxiredoxin